MARVAYGYGVMHLMAHLRLSASDNTIEELVGYCCSGESSCDFPGSSHSQMARDLPLSGIDGQSLPLCHSPKLTDRRNTCVNVLEEWKGIGFSSTV